MQKELEASHPDLPIQVVVINQAGFAGGNANAANGRDLPLLQDFAAVDAWSSWNVDWRDVVIVDANSEVVTTYNLTGFNLSNTDNYDELKEVLVDSTAPALVSGDCNGDFTIDASDLSCASDVIERDLVLDALNTLPGDLDGNGEVAFADFLLLSTNFGKDLPSYADGNIDLQNGVDFADFLVLSSNFGRTLPAASTDAAFGEWN